MRALLCWVVGHRWQRAGWWLRPDGSQRSLWRCARCGVARLTRTAQLGGRR
ncbi:MAG: hypothetical protein Q8R91_10855 [Candidatus Omnitrophota bacterium]|nr:hypothetical protein [Candidatus Omnitrophota bacterium]